MLLAEPQRSLVSDLYFTRLLSNWQRLQSEVKRNPVAACKLDWLT